MSIRHIAFIAGLALGLPVRAQVVAPAPPPPPPPPTLSQLCLFIYPSKGQPPEQQRQDEAAQQGATQAAAQNQAALETFKKAAGVCLEGRGYSVK